MWTIKDIEKLQISGKIRGYKGIISKNKEKAMTVPRNEPKGLLFIKQLLIEVGIMFETEYQFAKPRKFRFDIAIIEKKIAVEYEGIVSSKSRHTSITGYTGDATKYNLAASFGWKVYRYTALNYKDFKEDLKKILLTGI